jgi:hypothetical protein
MEEMESYRRLLKASPIRAADQLRVVIRSGARPRDQPGPP